MTTRLLVAVLTAGLETTTLWAAQGRPDEKIAIYVGPQIRDGFVDVDQGVLDSIRDIQVELGKQRKQLTAVRTPDLADIVLVVVRRGLGGPSGGAVGIPVGGITIYSPVNARFVETILRVGTYERTIVGEDHNSANWGKCAEQVIKHVMTWVKMNRERLRKE